MYQIEMFPCPMTANDESRTRRPSWGELITLSNDEYKTREAALEFANLLWIGTSARIFLVLYDVNNITPKTAWEIRRPGFELQLERGFPLRRLK